MSAGHTESALAAPASPACITKVQVNATVTSAAVAAEIAPMRR